MAPDEESALDDTVDSSRGTEQRATRVPTPADGACDVDEPQRRVGVHGPVGKGRTACASPGEGVRRTDLGAVPDGVGAVRHPTPRRPDVVPQGLQAAECVAGPSRPAALRCRRPNRHRLGERQTGGVPRRRIHGVQRGHHRCAAAGIAAGVDGAGRRPQRGEPVPGRQATQRTGGVVLHGIVGHLADGVDGAGARRAYRQARHHLGSEGSHCHATGFGDE